MRKQLISLLALTAALWASAQSITGSWELFPSYSTPSKVIETPEFVYVLTGTSISSNIPTGGSLSYYDKTTDEVGSLNSTNRLNSNKVYNMWYDPKEGCLFVFYEDYNIDLVFDDGRTIGLPDLRDAAITDDKLINTVGFANGKAYAGLNSGMLVIDMDHGAITESALWGKKITQIAASEKKIILVADNNLYFGNQAGSHHNFDNSFAVASSDYNKKLTNLFYLGNNLIYGVDSSKGYLYTIKEDADINDTPFTFSTISNHSGLSTVGAVTPTKSGAMLQNGSTLNYVNNQGEYTKISIDDANGSKTADWNSNGSAPWLANADGFGKYNSNGFTRVKPKGTSGSNVGRIIQHPLTDEFYISTAEIHQNNTVYSLSYVNSSYADIYNSKSKSFTAIPASLLRKYMAAFDINPYDANQIFTSRHVNMGDIVNLDSQTKIEITVDNSGASSIGSLKSWQVDKSGNLWMVKWSANSTFEVIKALKGYWETSIDKSGWSYYQVDGLLGNHSSRMMLDEDKNIVFLTGHKVIAAIQMPDANKPLTSACKSVLITNSIDSDGSSIDAYKYPTIAIDKNGWVWIGNEVGVMYIKDSREMFNSGFAVTRPKVPRNDGTNLADYLLNQVEIMCIAVDENNNKWIGTMGSGLYRVNEDGTEILEHFTTSDSDIPSDDILAVCPDRNSNDIYIGTAEGLAIYHATSAPAASNYKDAYAYPNPVTPDFTGYITITGLMSDSLVKITDAAGNIIHETTSDGGLALWNGCDANGRRVRSGVYFVFASQSSGDTSSAAVTKIVVVN